jgi:uncharacterized repeat protein (TIGR03803 family)
MVRKLIWLAGFALAGMSYTAYAGVALTTLHLFNPFPNGSDPTSALVEGTDGNFYGTTEKGGSENLGTVFKITKSGFLTTLHSFAGPADGGSPSAGLVLGRDGNFYGTTQSGGSNFSGTVFRISASGAFTSLYSFTYGNDGANPYGGLVEGNDGNFYGTTQTAGSNASGTVFEIDSNGVFNSLYSFTGGPDGANPYAGLILAKDGYLYGTTYAGGSNGAGTVFKISTKGALTGLYSFTGADDGANPCDALVQGSDGYFYGTTYNGGTNNSGTVFKINSNGAITRLYSFTGMVNDGANPYAGMVQGGDGYFYGATVWGYYGHGSIFRISATGDYASLHSFNQGVGNPRGGLVLGDDGSFYGTISGELGGGNGAVIRINSNGILDTLFTFTGQVDGANPLNSLVQGSDGNLYSTTYYGGTNGRGIIFRISTNGALYQDLYSAVWGVGGLTPGNDGNLYTFETSHLLQVSTNGSVNDLYSASETPIATLIGDSDGVFYGVSLGSIFEIRGGVLTNLYTFPDSVQIAKGRDGYLYGTTYHSGIYDRGLFFKLSTNGMCTNLYSFDGTNGAFPAAALVQGPDDYFYGSTLDGGFGGAGTLFKISTNGTFTSLHKFNTDDGANPLAPLVCGADSCFYGTTYTGGAFTFGTVFRISTNGSFTSLYSFTGGNDGANPEGGLLQLADGSLYGTASAGGLGGGVGTVFRLTVSGPPAPLFLSAGISQGAISLTFSTEPGNGYQLQYNSDLGSTHWTNLGEVITASSTSLSFLDSVTNGA